MKEYIKHSFWFWLATFATWYYVASFIISDKWIRTQVETSTSTTARATTSVAAAAATTSFFSWGCRRLSKWLTDSLTDCKNEWAKDFSFYFLLLQAYDAFFLQSVLHHATLTHTYMYARIMLKKVNFRNEILLLFCINLCKKAHIFLIIYIKNHVSKNAFAIISLSFRLFFNFAATAASLENSFYFVVLSEKNWYSLFFLCFYY